MKSEVLILEFVILIALYFKYFGNMVFISYSNLSPDKWEYENMAAELEKRLPEYRVHWGSIGPPNFYLIFFILAQQFFFGGLYKLISKIFSMGTKVKLLIFVIILATLTESKNNFGIHYESHTVFSKQSPDMEIPNVDELVDIIKENASGLTLPRGIAFAGLFYFLNHLESPRRRR